MTQPPLLLGGSSHPAFLDSLMESDRELRTVAPAFQRGDCLASQFADGEIQVEIGTSVRGRDVFIIQPTCPPYTNNALMELCITIDACKRASADRITAVIPYFGYARQDRKTTARAPITAALVARFIEGAGADRVLTMDLHSPAIQGFFGIPVDNLYGYEVLGRRVSNGVIDDPRKWVVVAPDAGATKLVERYASLLGCSVAFVGKTRPAPNVSKVTRVVGDVEGFNCILVDDMLDTAGTLCGAAAALRERGALRIVAATTHGLFSGPALSRLAGSVIEQVFVTDTVPLRQPTIFSDPVVGSYNIDVASVAPLFTHAIRRLHDGGSISELFNS